MFRPVALSLVAVSAIYAGLISTANARPPAFAQVLRPFAAMLGFLVVLVGLWHLMRPARLRSPATVYAVNGLVVGLFSAFAPVLSGLTSLEDLSGRVAASQVVTLVAIGWVAGILSRRHKGTTE